MSLFGKRDPLVGRYIYDYHHSGGRYRIHALLNSGGMGAVYKVSEEHTNRVFAIKLLATQYASDDEQRERFLRESRAAEKINHPNVIRAIQTGATQDGLFFLVMEYLTGPTLAEEITSGPLSVKKAIAVVTQIAQGLARAHNIGIIHRDIKPENIMFATRQKTDNHVKIFDFGLATIQGELRITATGQVFGTPEYVSPEQAIGRPATPRSDLYALGVLFYETVTGLLPFMGTPTKVMHDHVHTPPKAPSKVRPEAMLPYLVDRVILKLLNKNPNERYRDAHHLIDDLTELAENFGENEPCGPRYSLTPAPPVYKPMVSESHSSPTHRLKEIDSSIGLLSQASRPSWIPQTLEQIRGLDRQSRALRDELTQDTEERYDRHDRRRRQFERLGNLMDRCAMRLSRLERSLVFDIKERDQLLTELEDTPTSGGEARSKLNEQLVQIESTIKSRTLKIEELRYQFQYLRGKMGALMAIDSSNEHAIPIAQIRHDYEEITCQLLKNIERIERYIKTHTPKTASKSSSSAFS